MQSKHCTSVKTRGANKRNCKHANRTFHKLVIFGSRPAPWPVQFVVEPSDPLEGIDSDDDDVMPKTPLIKSPNKRAIVCLLKDIVNVSVTGRYNTLVPVSRDLDFIAFYFVF